MQLQNGTQILPNWTISFREVSNNVYEVMLTDVVGRQASTTDHDLERAVETCEAYAFGIERQFSKNWSRFLFEYTILKLQGVLTFSNGDPKNAYGSWAVGVKDKMISYDGRDDILLVKDGKADEFDYKVVSLKDVSFNTFWEYTDFVKQ